jgi:16S rRNA (guanine(966)-N(2))-methyltransferase RsmD
MLRVTGGALRGRLLPAALPEGVRPTSARTREALFSIVGQDLDGLSFLDAFGGAGLIAIEAWSRGARPVTLFERNLAALAAIRMNVGAVGAQLDLRHADASTLRNPDGSAVMRADIVYLDPPFSEDIGVWIDRLAACAVDTLVAEARTGAAFPSRAGALPLDRTRKYGESTLAIYRGG